MVLFRRRSSLTPTKSFSTGELEWEEDLSIELYNTGVPYPSEEDPTTQRKIDFENDCHQQQNTKKVVVVLEFPPGFALMDGPPDLLGPNHHPNDPYTGWIQETSSTVSTLSPCSCRYYRMPHHSPICPVAPNQPMVKGPPKTVLEASSPARVKTAVGKPSSTTPTTATSVLSRSQRIKDWENRPMLVLPQTSASSRQERTIFIQNYGGNRRRSSSDSKKMIHKTAGRTRKATGFGLGKVRHYEQEQEVADQTLDRHTQLDTTCFAVPARATTTNSFGHPKRTSFWQSLSNRNMSKNYKFSVPKHELS